MKYSKAVLFVVGSGVLGSVLAVPTHPSAGQAHPVPALGSDATHSGNSTNTLSTTTAAHPDGPNTLTTTTRLHPNPESVTPASELPPHTHTKKLRRKHRLRKHRLSHRKARLGTHPPTPETAVAQMPQNLTEASTPQHLSQSVQEKPKEVHDQKHGKQHLPAPVVPAARSFEDDDLFVRDPEATPPEPAPEATEEKPKKRRHRRKKHHKKHAAAPVQEARDLDEDLSVRETVPVPQHAENLEASTPEPVPHHIKHHKKHHSKHPAAEVPTARDLEENLFRRMVQTLVELDRRDFLDLDSELAARALAYEMDEMD